MSAHTKVSPSHLEMCILRKRKNNANATQSQQRQTTNTFPVPNPNYPGLCSRRGKSCHLEGLQGTLAPGTRVDKHRWRAAEATILGRTRTNPHWQLERGAAARDARAKAGQLIPSRPASAPAEPRPPPALAHPAPVGSGAPRARPGQLLAGRPRPLGAH